MKIVFFGSDDFAAAHLRALMDSPHQVLACLTQPDKPRGRGWKVSASPVKECARERKIPVLEPVELKEQGLIARLRGLESDLFVVIAYGRFLPTEILAVPRIFTVNVHSSLLPKYRGAAPIQWAVIRGECETGLSIMTVTLKMDAGDILAQQKMAIADTDTAAMLRARMMIIGPEFLLKAIDAIDKGDYTLTPQDEQKATLAPKMTKELGHIVWREGARGIHNLIRGLIPWPTAYTFYQGKILKVLESSVVPGDFSRFEPGKVVQIGREGFVVATGENGLLVRQVHLEASKKMDAYRFTVGHKIQKGFQFT
jgi:methionyl-tRNA formyltransferase